MKKNNAANYKTGRDNDVVIHLLEQKKLLLRNEKKPIDPAIQFSFYATASDASATKNYYGQNIYQQKNDYASTLVRKLINCQSPLINKQNLHLKRAFDITFSFLACIILFPWLIPLLAIMIKLNSKGPVFFLQKRNKRNGAVFNCLKFRTMIVNPEADLRSAFGTDERITSLGKLLRRYHIDELPQLINVFLGDMSLIGPRPHMIAENLLFQHAIAEYAFRNEVKPGITGLAQSLGNFGSIKDIGKMNKRLFFDLFYIKKWSLRLDIEILFRTFRRTVLNKRN